MYDWTRNYLNSYTFPFLESGYVYEDFIYVVFLPFFFPRHYIILKFSLTYEVYDHGTADSGSHSIYQKRWH